MGKRGRKLGYKMSEKSKKAISETKTGQKHTEETKQRISDGVRGHHETGVPIEVLLQIDLDNCVKTDSGRGYIDVLIPKGKGKSCWKMRLSRAIMEQELGRKLEPGEEVHHWGDRDNNNIALLTLAPDREHHNMLDRARKNVKQYLFEKWKGEK